MTPAPSLWRLAQVEAQAFRGGDGGTTPSKIAFGAATLVALAAFDRRVHPFGAGCMPAGPAVAARLLVHDRCRRPGRGDRRRGPGPRLGAFGVDRAWCSCPWPFGRRGRCRPRPVVPGRPSAGTGDVYVHSVASTRPGAGAELMTSLAGEADRKGWLLVLDAGNERLGDVLRQVRLRPWRRGADARRDCAGAHVETASRTDPEGARMRPSRARALADVVGVVLCELALLVFFWEAAGLFGSVDVGHLVTWAQQSSPEAALTALVRLLGICVSTWLLVSTAVYGVGALTGSRRLFERSRLVTPALVRRILDTLAAASVAASSIGSMATMAGASAVPTSRLQPGPRAAPRPPGRVAGRPWRRRRSGTSERDGVGPPFPPPGRGASWVAAAATPAAMDDGAPSPENGFAGLPAGTKVVVVRPGDCLSVLAERHLGDWRLDTEIEALNYGRLQPDGRALVDDHWIYPGWVLVMPANAVGATVVVGGTLARPRAQAMFRLRAPVPRPPGGPGQGRLRRYRSLSVARLRRRATLPRPRAGTCRQRPRPQRRPPRPRRRPRRRSLAGPAPGAVAKDDTGKHRGTK